MNPNHQVYLVHCLVVVFEKILPKLNLDIAINELCAGFNFSMLIQEEDSAAGD